MAAFLKDLLHDEEATLVTWIKGSDLHHFKPAAVFKEDVALGFCYTQRFVPPQQNIFVLPAEVATTRI